MGCTVHEKSKNDTLDTYRLFGSCILVSLMKGTYHTIRFIRNAAYHMIWIVLQKNSTQFNCEKDAERCSIRSIHEWYFKRFYYSWLPIYEDRTLEMDFILQDFNEIFKSMGCIGNWTVEYTRFGKCAVFNPDAEQIGNVSFNRS